MRRSKRRSASAGSTSSETSSGQALGPGVDRRHDALVVEDRRVDALGDRADVTERPAHVVLGAGDGGHGGVGGDGDLIDRQAQLAGQRRQLLLHAVVDVALDAPSLLVLGLDDARPRRRDLGRLMFDLVETGRQLVGLLDGVQPQRRLAAERTQELSVVGVEQRPAALAPALEQRRGARRRPSARTWPRRADRRPSRPPRSAGSGRRWRRGPSGPGAHAASWPRAVRAPRSARRARPRRRTRRSRGHRCRCRPTATGPPRARASRAPEARAPPSPALPRGRGRNRTMCPVVASTATHTSPPAAPTHDTRPTPTATRRDADGGVTEPGSATVAADADERCGPPDRRGGTRRGSRRRRRAVRACAPAA